MTEEYGAENLGARLTAREDGETECTIYPQDASREQRMTEWIASEEGSYMELGGGSNVPDAMDETETDQSGEVDDAE